MKSYLFKIQQKGIPDPFHELLNAFLPSAKRSIFVIDHEPPREVIEHLVSHTPRSILCRFLTDIQRNRQKKRLKSVPFDPSLYSEIDKAGVEIRVLPQLSARVYIVDDTVMVISGNPPEEIAYGILFSMEDSQPVIAYWETIFKGAARLTRKKITQHLNWFHDELQQGTIHREDVVKLINIKGAFIDVHVNLFKGFLRKPLASVLPGDSSKADRSLTWRLIPASHLKRLNNLATKIYSMKSRAYLIQTPAGIYLTESYRTRWEKEFTDRSKLFLIQIEDYLVKHYDGIRKEASESLEVLLHAYFTKHAQTEPCLPIFSQESLNVTMKDILVAQFPSVPNLMKSCQIWYVRLGLHPDMAQNKDFITLLQKAYHQVELL